MKKKHHLLKVQPQKQEAEVSLNLSLNRDEAEVILSEFQQHFTYFGGSPDYPDQTEAFSRVFCLYVEQTLLANFNTTARALSCIPHGGLREITETTQIVEVGLNVELPLYSQVGDWLHYLDDTLAIEVMAVNVIPKPFTDTATVTATLSEEEQRKLNIASPVEVSTQLAFRVLTYPPVGGRADAGQTDTADQSS